MKIIIRTDASTQIGTGHTMRCMAISEALRDKGAEVHFICRDLPGNLNHIVKAKGFCVHRLQQPLQKIAMASKEDLPIHAPWLEVPWQQDMAETLDVIKDIAHTVDWLIVDHYAIDNRWETGMRGAANNIMIIDDLADRSHFCDILLDQNYFENAKTRYKALIPENCRMLLGPKFALLRPEFRYARQFVRHRGNGIARLLVYFGGNDPDDLTGLTLSALCCREFESLYVDLVIGLNNPRADVLQEMADNRPRTWLHVQPDGFAELMLRADLAIGAGGTTTWERLCLNLSSIVITIAENQVHSTAQLHKVGYVCWIGRSKTITEYQIKATVMKEIKRLQVENLITDPGIVDGMGSLRVAEAIIPSRKSDLKLRPARIEDMETYFYWANDPETRSQSFNPEMITWPEHIAWYKSKIASADTFMWVMETPQGLPVGQIRFDMHDNVAMIDYSLDHLVRGRGWAKNLILSGVNVFKSHFKNAQVQAKVKVSNLSSCKVFHLLNFLSTKNKDIMTFSWHE